jgi:hypothetical protein
MLVPFPQLAGNTVRRSQPKPHGPTSAADTRRDFFAQPAHQVFRLVLPQQMRALRHYGEIAGRPIFLSRQVGRSRMLEMRDSFCLWKMQKG